MGLLWEKFDAAQKERAQRLFALLLRTGSSPPLREPAPDLRFAAQSPGAGSRFKVATLRALEWDGRSSAWRNLDAALGIYRQVNGGALASRDLLDMLKWPTLDPTVASQLAELLAQSAGLPASAFLRQRTPLMPARYGVRTEDETPEVNPWALAKWAAARGFDRATPARPAGYE